MIQELLMADDTSRDLASKVIFGRTHLFPRDGVIPPHSLDYSRDLLLETPFQHV